MTALDELKIEWLCKEVELLRQALLDVIVVFEIGNDTLFHEHYDQLIERAELNEYPFPRP